MRIESDVENDVSSEGSQEVSTTTSSPRASVTIDSVLKNCKSGTYLAVHWGPEFDNKWYNGTLLVISKHKGEEYISIGYDDGVIVKSPLSQMPEFKIVTRPQDVAQATIEFLDHTNGILNKKKYIVDCKTGHVTLELPHGKEFKKNRFIVVPEDIRYVDAEQLKGGSASRRKKRQIAKLTTTTSTFVPISALSEFAPLPPAPVIPITAEPAITDLNIEDVDREIAALQAKLDALKNKSKVAVVTPQIIEKFNELESLRQQQLAIQQKLREDTTALFAEFTKFKDVMLEAEAIVQPMALNEYMQQHPTLMQYASVIAGALNDGNTAQSLWATVIKPFVQTTAVQPLLFSTSSTRGSAAPDVKRARYI